MLVNHLFKILPYTAVCKPCTPFSRISGTLLTRGFSNNETATAVVEKEGPKEILPKEVLPRSTVNAELVPRKRMKHKIPQKKASKLLNELRAEAVIKQKRHFPEFRPGDAIKVTMKDYLTSNETQVFKGTVLAINNRDVSKNFTILHTLLGEVVEQEFDYYSPVIMDIEVLQKARIHDGKKRVRRSKLYYLRDRNPDEYDVR